MQCQRVLVTSVLPVVCHPAVPLKQRLFVLATEQTRAKNVCTYSTYVETEIQRKI